MDIQLQKGENLEGKILMTLTKEDLDPSFDKELKKIRKEATFKGFRPGKVPASVVKKMYGRSILADIVQKRVQEELWNYIQNEKLRILGYPMSSKDQELLDFEDLNRAEYNFTFDVGMSPELDLKGLGEEVKLQQYKVQVADKTVDEEYEELLKRNADKTNPESDIQDKDIIEIEATEIVGEDNKDKQPHITTFSLMVDRIKHDDLKESILGKGLGHIFEFDIYELENVDKPFVYKHFLKTSEEEASEIGQQFSGEIVEITRQEPPKASEELFKSVFGEDKGITTEEEAKEELRKIIADSYVSREEALLYIDMQDHILKHNSFDLPEAFLLRVRKSNVEETKEGKLELNDDEKEKFFEGVRWSIIKEKVIEDNEIKIEQEELIEAMKQRIRGMMQGYPMEDEFLTSMAERLMQDEKSVREAEDQLVSDKVFYALKDKVSIEEKPISEEDFNQIIKKKNEEAQSAQQTDSIEEE